MNEHDNENHGPDRRKLHPILETLLKGAAEALTLYGLEHAASIATTCTTWIRHLLT